MASQEEQLRLVAEVVDKFSPQLKQMLKSFQQISAAGKEVHEKGTKQTNEHAKAYKELGERVDRFRKFGVEALTPALGALGLAGLGVAESIKKMTESLQNAGEKYRWLQDITARGGVSAGYVDTMTRTFENMGIAGDKAGDAVARLGETFDKLKFGDPQEYQRLFSIFGNTLPYLDNIVKGARDREDAMTRIAKSITDTSIPIFQRRQLAEGLGLDPALASRTGTEFGQALRQAIEDETKHPINLALIKQISEAFIGLNRAEENFRTDMVNTFGPAGIQLINGFADAVNQMAEKAKQELADLAAILRTIRAVLNFDDKISGWVKGKLGVTEDPFADILHGKTPPLGFGGAGDTDKNVKEPVRQGVLDAFRQWIMENKATDAELFAGGYKPMAYHPDDGGGASGRGLQFGNDQYPLLGIETSPKAGTVPAGNGPDAAGIPRSARDVAKIVRDEWHRAGMSNEGIAGLMANIQDESSFNPNLRHPDQPAYGGEAHFAHGLYQEGGAEWNRYAAWLQKNYPGSDWRDPRMQSRFAAENLKTNYPGVWQQMLHDDRFRAAAAYVNGYLKPAAAYRSGRMAKYLHGGVAPLNAYTGPGDDHISADHPGASLTDLVRRGRSTSLLQYQKSSMNDAAMRGRVDVVIDHRNVPRGIRTKFATAGNLLKDVTVNRGYQMATGDVES